MPTCNICGKSEFADGPAGRRTASGMQPRCAYCQSMERHRLFRIIYDSLVDDDFVNYKVLQFSNDGTVRPDTVAEHEVSVYEGENSLDLQNIDRPDNEYDMVICNHVLEHVADDRAAISELSRVAKQDGFVFLSFPMPAGKVKTVDWGFPEPTQHGHYRVYGMDVVNLFRAVLPDHYVIMHYESDPVTGVIDVVYFICNNRQGFNRVTSKLGNYMILCAPEISLNVVPEKSSEADKTTVEEAA